MPEELTLYISESTVEKQLLRKELLRRYDAFGLTINNKVHGLTLLKSSAHGMPINNIRAMLRFIDAWSFGWQAARSIFVSDKTPYDVDRDADDIVKAKGEADAKTI